MQSTRRVRRRTGSWRETLLGMASAARAWAVAHPAAWALLYGSPVPGYHAPSESTVGPGTRVVGALFAVIAEGIAEGRHHVQRIALVPEPMSSRLRRDSRRVRLRWRRRHRDEVLSALGRTGGCDQPRSVRPVRRRHVDRSGGRLRGRRSNCWWPRSRRNTRETRTRSSQVVSAGDILMAMHDQTPVQIAWVTRDIDRTEHA